MKSLDVAMTAVNAALYSLLGYVIFVTLPITTPGVGIVRFWPNVVIPAVCAVLFGPWVGGLGAAIGIFVSDTLIHHDPLLSIVAGVTSNFVGFYLIGYISRRNIDWAKMVAMSSIALLIGCTISEYFLLTYVSLNAAILFISLTIAAFILAIAVGYWRPNWRSYGIASLVGLGLGSAIIGFTVWLYSQFIVLPVAVGGGYQLPFYVAFIWFIWTFATEIPFLIVMGPPILEACYRAFPSLKPPRERSR